MRRSIMIALALVAASCSSNNNSVPPGDGSGTGSGDGSGPIHPGATFRSFVIALINNQTADNTAPVAFDSFASLSDPDLETNNTNAFSSLF